MHLPSQTMTRRIALLGVGAAGVGIWLGVRYRGDAFTGAQLTPDEAHRAAARGEILLVDIRRPDEWHRTGLPENGVALDMRADDFIPRLLALSGGDRTAPVALICARGVRSDRLSARLADEGFTNIADVPEGMLGSSAGPGWLARGLPVKPMR